MTRYSRYPPAINLKWGYVFAAILLTVAIVGVVAVILG